VRTRRLVVAGYSDDHADVGNIDLAVDREVGVESHGVEVGSMAAVPRPETHLQRAPTAPSQDSGWIGKLRGPVALFETRSDDGRWTHSGSWGVG
jgi:hypothetical protein